MEARTYTGWWSFSGEKGPCLQRGEAGPMIPHHLHCKAANTQQSRPSQSEVKELFVFAFCWWIFYKTGHITCLAYNSVHL